MATASPFGSPPKNNFDDQVAKIRAANTAAATTGSFDESKGVAGRVQSITAQGGPLMQAARTRAKMAMQKRGTQNTSLAGQAGEQAVIETASPIASADAQLHQQQQLANQAASNQAAMLNAQLGTQAGLQAMSLGENSRQFDSTLGWDKEKFNSNQTQQQKQFDASLGWDKEKTGASLLEQKRQYDGTLGMEGKKLDQQGLQFNTQMGMEGQKLSQQGNQFTANLAEQKRQSEAQFGLEGQKLAQQGSQFDKQMGMEGQKLNMQSEQFKANMSQQDRQFADKLTLEKSQLEAQREQFAQKFGLDVSQLQLNRDQMGQQDRQFLADLDAKQQQMAQQESQFVRDQTNRVTLANLDAGNREKLMGIEAKYKNDIANNENISRAWGSMMDGISQIQNNPDLDNAAKTTMIQNAQAGFQSFTKFQQKLTGFDMEAIKELLNFGPTGSVPVTGGGKASDAPPPNVNQGGSGDSAGRYWDFDSKQWRIPGTDYSGGGG